MSVADLPRLNAVLNGIGATLLVIGYLCVRRRLVRLHLRFMIAACVASAAFLASYLTFHALAGSVKFQGQGAIRPVYYTILLTHTVLAAAIVPMVLLTLLHAARERWERHRRIARWTFPLWVYVDVTGVVVYLMLASTGSYDQLRADRAESAGPHSAGLIQSHDF